MTPFYMTGHSVVATLLDDPAYIDLVLVIDEDRLPAAGLFTKRGESI
ncbi:hypothetical protein KIS4809_4646 [Bacillus sp. ZZV12-4809]|nr:hypothetical protein KIS4809_4646 [Bacillus sp. ZZV12-4809]